MRKFVSIVLCLILLGSTANADVIGTINTTDIKAFIKLCELYKVSSDYLLGLDANIKKKSPSN